jgi:hypothetical protein
VNELAATLAPLLEALRPIVDELVEEKLATALRDATRPRWMTLEEAAEHVRSTPAALRKRAQRGTLPGAVRDGSRWLVDARQLDTSLDPATFGRDHTKRGERRANGLAPGTGNGGSDA